MGSLIVSRFDTFDIYECAPNNEENLKSLNQIISARHDTTFFIFSIENDWRNFDKVELIEFAKYSFINQRYKEFS